jgi:hypothetical protein
LLGISAAKAHHTDELAVDEADRWASAVPLAPVNSAVEVARTYPISGEIAVGLLTGVFVTHRDDGFLENVRRLAALAKISPASGDRIRTGIGRLAPVDSDGWDRAEFDDVEVEVFAR